jgi:DNA mismatch endonuclease, patch repair protein
MSASTLIKKHLICKKKAGHRSWAHGNAPVPGKHRGDIMTSDKRSRVMAMIKGKNTRPELTIFALLKEKRKSFDIHVKNLPGKPDIYFRKANLAVFLDGDFWHGWRFPLWKHKLSKKWQDKIAFTRKRDQKNFRKLRQKGIKVIRIWEHQIEQASEKCADRILKALEIDNRGI